MHGLIRVLGSVGNGVERVLDAIVFILTFSSIWLFCYLVFMRYILGRAHDWGDELVQVIIVTAMVLAAAGTTRVGGHTTIDYLPSKLSGKRRIILLTAGYAVSIVVCGILGWTGIEIANLLRVARLTSTSSLPIPEWVDYATLPLVLFCSAFYYLEKVVQNTQQLRSGSGVGKAL